MTEDILEPIDNERYYSIRTIVISSLFASCFASGYMAYKNFVRAGEPAKARMTIVATLAFAGVLILSGISPDLEKIPNVVYTIFFTFLTSVLVNRYQRKLIENKIAAGAEYHSTGKAVAVCLVVLAILIAVVLGAFYMADGS
ncbi:MAG: hypothetical protein EOO13_03320 [Chitinophagaceae bacterium]|nr:MAG: hypothetical protein EOO13_03320 [Chitinophagaceae bacterium]